MEKYALIGQNIGYSLSPKIHGLIFDFFGLKDHSYGLIDVSAGQFESCFDGLCLEYAGFNITIPLKYEAAKHLSINNSPINAVNTITVCDGRTTGYNTDIDGFLCSLEKNDCAKLADVLIIGAGGAAEAATYALGKLKKSPCIKSRNSERAQRLMEKYNLAPSHQDFAPNLIVNASGKNLVTDGLLTDINTKNLKAVFDMSYCYDELREHFEQGKINYINGLDMLIYQAIQAAQHLYKIEAKSNIQSLYSHIKRGISK